MLIRGKQLLAERTIPITNPATGGTIWEMPVGSRDDVDLAIRIAQEGRTTAKKMSRYQRSRCLQEAANFVQESTEDFVSTIVEESGKTLVQARKEVARCINTLTVSAEEAKRFVGETIPFDSVPGSENRSGHYEREPIGIVLAITPFNDPLNLVAHKLGPAIASGNAVILKPSEKAPISAINLAKAFLEGGLPPEVLSVVTGDAATANALVERDEVRMISFTGGKLAAKKITERAGIKRISMDLGGNAPVIVCADCDLNHAVDSCVSGAFWASGQNCIGVQRIFVETQIFKDFLSKFKERTSQLKWDDPAEETTDVGPMISVEEAQRTQDWVHQAVKLGGDLVTGHELKGAFYRPTVLTNVSKEAKVICEEVFAPVVVIESFDQFDDVLQEANKPEFLLHAGIFTNDMSRAKRAISELEVGGIMINDSSDYRLDAMPFGGAKRGSMGREGVRFAMEEMSHPKVVCFTDIGT